MNWPYALYSALRAIAPTVAWLSVTFLIAIQTGDTEANLIDERLGLAVACLIAGIMTVVSIVNLDERCR